ncbi:MAG TPA: hypothetical protein ENJ35_05300, partial [Gammaproteobacteria bacterium]|nr:hypothetical protein [Gammaproteobacteria bacterium]
FDRYADLGSMPADGAGAGQIAEVGSTTEGFYNVMKNLDYSKQANFAYAPNATNTAGTFTIELDKINGNVNTKSLEFTYADNNGQLEFTCAVKAGDTIANKYLPSQCQ